MKLIIIAAVTAIMLSCNSSRTSTNSNGITPAPTSTIDTATTNNIPNPDSTQHR